MLHLDHISPDWTALVTRQSWAAQRALGEECQFRDGFEFSTLWPGPGRGIRRGFTCWQADRQTGRRRICLYHVTSSPGRLRVVSPDAARRSRPIVSHQTGCWTRGVVSALHLWRAKPSISDVSPPSPVVALCQARQMSKSESNYRILVYLVLPHNALCCNLPTQWRLQQFSVTVTQQPQLTQTVLTDNRVVLSLDFTGKSKHIQTGTRKALKINTWINIPIVLLREHQSASKRCGTSREKSCEIQRQNPNLD